MDNIIAYCNRYRDTIEYKEWLHMKKICKRKKKRSPSILILYQILKEKYHDILNEQKEIVSENFEEIQLSDTEEFHSAENISETNSNLIVENISIENFLIERRLSVKDLIKFFEGLSSK